jgi:hypothetical protein
MKGVIEAVFGEVLAHLVETGHVKLEHYFVDGTKIEADTNKWGLMSIAHNMQKLAA